MLYARGRAIDDGSEVSDILVDGLHGLVGPLQDYNTAFDRLCVRRKVELLVRKNCEFPIDGAFVFNGSYCYSYK